MRILLPLTFAVCAMAFMSPADDANIVWLGRWDKANGTATAAWSGTGIQVAFTGPSVSLTIADAAGHSWWDVWVDSDHRFAGENMGQITISGLGASATHTMKAVRRTENAQTGAHTLKSIDLAPGHRTMPWSLPLPTRKIEFVGDSFTCGYGVLGENSSCHFSLDTEDVTKAYGFLTAEHFNAELFMESWSGSGLIRNYGETCPSATPMPYYLQFTTSPEAGIKWDWSYHPDAIVVYLGTNDFAWGQDDIWPSGEVYEDAYRQLLKTLLSGTPSAQVFVVSIQYSAWAKYVQDVAKQAGDNVHYVEMPYLSQEELGCDAHPNILGQANMAKTIQAALHQVMGW